jgi:hypothetical protein
MKKQVIRHKKMLDDSFKEEERKLSKKNGLNETFSSATDDSFFEGEQSADTSTDKLIGELKC